MIMWLQIVGIIMSSLLATVVFTIVFFGLLSRFTNWLYTHHAAKMVKAKNLLRLPSHDVTKNSDSLRYDSKIEVWCEDCFEKAYQWIGSFIGKFKAKKNRDCQSKQRNNRRPNTITVDSSYNRLPRTLLRFSQSCHIRTIVSRLRRGVNQSGKEPFAGYQVELTLVRHDDGVCLYEAKGFCRKEEAWLSPALFRSFDTPPGSLYVKAEPRRSKYDRIAPEYLMNMWGNATSVHRLTLNVICHGEVCQAFYLDALLFNAECQQGWA